jgi:Rrf2 family protein
MQLTAKSEYALLALIELAGRESTSPLSVRELAASRDLPVPYLEQLFSTLRRAGIVRSVRGAHGGYVLTRGAAEITVLEIVEALEGPIAPTACDGANCPSADCCGAVTVWSSVTDAMRDVLASFTLAAVAEEESRRNEKG